MTVELSPATLVGRLSADELDDIVTGFIKVFSSPGDHPPGADTTLDSFFKLADENPEMLIEVILAVLERDPNDKVRMMLAVGPLTIFLDKRGESLCSLVEEIAESNEAFCQLLDWARRDFS